MCFDVHLFCRNAQRLSVRDVLGFQLEYGAVKSFYVKLNTESKCNELVSSQDGVYIFGHEGGNTFRVWFASPEGSVRASYVCSTFLLKSLPLLWLMH